MGKNHSRPIPIGKGNISSTQEKNQYTEQFSKLKEKISEFNQKVLSDPVKIAENITLQEPIISFINNDWKNDNQLESIDEIVKKFMQNTICQEGYFIDRNERNLSPILKELKKHQFESLSNFIKEITDNGFEKICEDLFKSSLSKKNILSEISNLIKKILNNEEAKKHYISKFTRCNESIKQNKEILKIHHFTVLVIGKAGSGKTCLINNVLKLRPITNERDADRENIEVGVEGGYEKKGGFATKVNHAYISNKVNGIRIIDTPGCDLAGNNVHNVDNTIAQSKKEINKQAKSKDQSDHVAIIWYCFTGERFDKDVDSLLINKIKETYSQKNQIPVIIVRTEAYFNEDTKLFENICKENNPGVDYIGVVAKEKIDTDKNVRYEQKNLNRLIELSIENIQRALKGEFFKILNKDIKNYIIDNLTQENENICNYIKNKIWMYFINNYNKALNGIYLMKFLYNLFNICVTYYLIEFKNSYISEKSLTAFKSFIDNLILDKAVKSYKELTETVIEEILFKEAIDLIDMQEEIQINNGKNIETKYLKKSFDYGIIVKNFLGENFYYMAQKKLIYIIITCILFEFCDSLKNELNKLIIDLIDEECIENMIKDTYILKFEELKQTFRKEGHQNNQSAAPSTPAYPKYKPKYQKPDIGAYPSLD